MTIIWVIAVNVGKYASSLFVHLQVRPMGFPLSLRVYLDIRRAGHRHVNGHRKLVAYDFIGKPIKGARFGRERWRAGFGSALRHV